MAQATTEVRAPASTRLEPSRGWVELRLKEVWAYRELLYFLTWRDIKVRYKQSILGAAWAIIQPVMSMIIFTIIFAKLAGLESDGHAYQIWNYAALVPWTFFANGLTTSSNSLVGSQNLIKKIYFPRLVIPTAAVLAGVVDFTLAFAVLLVLMPIYGVTPTLNMVFLPGFLIIAFMASLGMGLWLSALNVQFRDVRFTVPFLIQIWMYATPIVWGSSLIDEPFRGIPVGWLRAILALNPMVGPVEGFRWALGVGNAEMGFPGTMVLISGVVAAAIFVGGMFYFRRMEKTFADVV